MAIRASMNRQSLFRQPFLPLYDSRSSNPHPSPPVTHHPASTRRRPHQRICIHRTDNTHLIHPLQACIAATRMLFLDPRSLVLCCPPSGQW
jgi:hypothetical protein